VVLPGRAFLRRLFDLTRGLQKPHHRVKLKRGCKEDFLHQFNGTCFFLDEIYLASEKLKLFTYASGSIGFGAVFETSWFNETWNIEWQMENITLKEFYPIVLLLEVWGERMANKCICFHCDNEAHVYVLNKQTSKEPKVMFLLRKLILMCLKNNMMFKAEHVPGKTNVLSDALSRFQMQRYFHLFPEVDKTPTRIPELPRLKP